MPAILWIGSFLLGRGKKALGVIGVAALLAILGLGAFSLLQHRAADSLRAERNEALVDLGECKATNEQNARDIAEINRQAAENEAAAQAAIERAERAAMELDEERRDAEQRHADELERLHAALAVDDCAAARVPRDLDRLLRESTGPQ